MPIKILTKLSMAVAILVVSLPGPFARGQMSRKSINKMSAKLAPCLPADIKLDVVAEYERPKEITIAEKLNKLNARCRRGRLVARNNQEIRFFKMMCFGIPPPNYEELQEEQRRKLNDLRSRYIVVVIGCDPRLP